MLFMFIGISLVYTNSGYMSLTQSSIYKCGKNFSILTMQIVLCLDLLLLLYSLCFFRFYVLYRFYLISFYPIWPLIRKINLIDLMKTSVNYFWKIKFLKSFDNLINYSKERKRFLNSKIKIRFV